MPECFADGFADDSIEVQILNADKSSIFMDSIWEVPTIMNSFHFEGYIKFKNVPACGYRSVIIKPAKIEEKASIPSSNTMENEFLKVTVNANGTVNVLNKQTGKNYKNLNYLSSQGEIGNAWKHQEPENDRMFTSLNADALIEVVENGKLCTTYRVTYSFEVPKDCIETQSDEMVSIPVTVYYSLKQGSKNLDVKVDLVNNAYDHWLRANFPTGIKADYTYSDSHFDIVRRDIKVPDSTGWVEKAYGMQPLRTFAAIEDETDGFALMPHGLYEYEAFEDTRMALTLIRGCRIKQAVSEEKITVLDDKGILCLGERSFEYSLSFYDCEISELCNKAAEVYAPALCAFAGRGNGKLAMENSLLSVDNQNVHISAIKPADDNKGIIIRIFNPTDSTRRVGLNFGIKVKKLYKTTMNEEIKEEITPDFEVEHHKIVTLYLEV